jgi:hypothetical protein
LALGSWFLVPGSWLGSFFSSQKTLLLAA